VSECKALAAAGVFFVSSSLMYLRGWKAPIVLRYNAGLEGLVHPIVDMFTLIEVLWADSTFKN
jgi:hypothetical protein